MVDMAQETLRSLEERWQNLTITNDFVFCKAMLDPDLCREVLEAILDISIERVEYVGHQDQLDASPSGKTIRLDVYVRDENGTVFNVEMQSANTRELPQRSRYYHALMSIDQLSRGDSYRSLKSAYVIFICNFDLFGENQRVYYFENTCRGSSHLTLGDGARTIFLAANAPRDAESSSPLNELLDYVSTGEVTGSLSAKLAAAVADVLDNQKWRLEYMILEVRDQLNFDRGKDEGLVKGREIGFAEGHEAGLAEGRETGLAEGREAGLAEGREAGLAEGREAGLAEGREAGYQEGRSSGEDRLSRLLATLLEAGRTTEIERAILDSSYREELYQEHGLA